MNVSRIKPRVIRYSLGGHADWIRDIAIHPDGKRIVTGSDDHTARLWDLGSLVCLGVFSGHSDTVRAVAIHPNGALLATGSWDRTIRLWNLKDGSCVRMLTGHEARIRKVAFSPDGEYLYSASEDKTARRWRVSDGECVLVFRGHAKSVRDLAVEGDGEVVYTADEEGVILAWDAATGKQRGQFHGHSDEVFTLALDSGNARLYSGGKDTVVRAWNTGTFRCEERYTGHTGWVMSLSLGDDRTRLVSADLDGVTKVWNLTNGACTFTHGGPTWVVNCVRFTRDPGTLLFASEHRVVSMNAQTGGVTRDFHGHAKNVACFCNAHGRGIMATSGWDGMTIVWDYPRGSVIHSLGHPATEKRGVISLCFSKDEDRLFTGSDNGFITVWSVRSGKCIKSFNISSDNIHGIAPTLDKSRIVIACRDLLDNIRVYDIGTGRHMKSLFGHENTVFSIDVSADGKLLASGSADRMAKIWDLENGMCVRTLSAHSDWVEAVRFSRDCTLLLTGGCDSVIRLWDVRTGKLLREFTGVGYNVYSLDISADNLRIVAAGNDKTIHMWDVPSGRMLREYRGNDYQLYKAVFAPGSDTILTGGKKTLRQWRLDSALGYREAMEYANAVCAMNANSYTRELVIGCWEYGSKKINLDTGAITMHYASTMSSVYAVALSHSGERLATGGRSMLTSLLDAKTGKQLRWFEHKDNVNALAVSVKADVIYTACSDGIARKWDVPSSTCKTLFEGHKGRVANLALSKDGTMLYTCGADSCIRIWNTDTGVCRMCCSGHADEANALSLSWSERTFASGSRDGTVIVWNNATGVCLRIIRTGVEVTALAYGPLDETILVGCNDGSIFVHRYTSFDFVKLAGHTSRISAIVFLEKTGCIVSSSIDGTVRFWSNDTGKLRATFYNLDRGYLWSTPPDEESESGWIWTDRPELVGVVESEKDGADPRALAAGDKERGRFIKTISNKAKVMERLRGIPTTRGAAARRTRYTESDRKLLE